MKSPIAMRYVDYGSSVNLVEEMEIEQAISKSKEKVITIKNIFFSVRIIKL